MIDVHCHANFHAYKDDADEVIQNALKNGVEIIINVGTKLDSSEKAIALAQKYEHLYAIVGVHPHHADKLELDQDAKNATMKGVARVGDPRRAPAANARMSDGGDERQDP